MSGGQRWEAMAVREYTKNDGTNGSSWTKVGAGFTNKDGSISIMLDAFPVTGKIVLQIPISKEERQAKWNSGQGQQRQSGGGGGGQQQRSSASRYRQREAPTPAKDLFVPDEDDDGPPIDDDGPPFR